MGGSILAFAPIAAPQISGHTAKAQICGSGYVRCERRNPGQFWSILSERQKMEGHNRQTTPPLVIAALVSKKSARPIAPVVHAIGSRARTSSIRPYFLAAAIKRSISAVVRHSRVRTEEFTVVGADGRPIRSPQYFARIRR
jgi:hypothetical protein